jgi:hypothetical protein
VELVFSPFFLGLTRAKQALYHLSHSISSPFLLLRLLYWRFPPLWVVP